MFVISSNLPCHDFSLAKQRVKRRTMGNCWVVLGSARVLCPPCCLVFSLVYSPRLFLNHLLTWSTLSRISKAVCATLWLLEDRSPTSASLFRTSSSLWVNLCRFLFFSPPCFPGQYDGWAEIGLLIIIMFIWANVGYVGGWGRMWRLYLGVLGVGILKLSGDGLLTSLVDGDEVGG